MIPDPLHPAVVHFPIALAFLLPMFAVGALWAIRRGAGARVAWAIPVALAVVLAGTAWAALETGEAEEERVEDVVAESPLHEHEEAGELFLVLSGLVALVAAAGMAGGTVGTAGRLLATVGSLAVLIAGVSVGRAGGELVYEHGAARPYVQAVTAGADPPAAEREHRDHDEEDD